MTTSIAPTPAPAIAAGTLHDQLAYMFETNRLMVGVRRPDGQMGALSERELRVQLKYFAAGRTPAAFVRHVLARRCRWCGRRTPAHRRRTGFCSDMCNLERYGAATKEDM
jgi:hypothetical protein